jgi:hypothetical protein
MYLVCTLSRRPERPDVVPIADHLPPAAEHAIHRQGQSDRQPVHAPACAPRLVSLDDEVTVILLDREMDHPKTIDRRARMARRSAPNSRGERSDGSPGVARMVACNGYRGSILGRVPCGIEGRPRGWRRVACCAKGSRRRVLIRRMSPS